MLAVTRARLVSLCVLAVVLAAPACGNGDGPQGPSGIEGLITIGPTCPAVQAGTSCPDEPYAGSIVILDADGVRARKVTAGEDGRFRTDLKPGRYTLVPQPERSGPPTPPGDQQVDVRAGAYTEVLIQYDSGIR